MIANINHVKNVLGELKAKKKFGQNFLIDANIVDKIASIACDSNTLTIEIGPGLGALTQMLLKYSKAVEAYEIDPDMYEIINATLKDDNLKVILQDFMDTDLSKYENMPIRVCSNLPYYVTTPILFKLFESGMDIQKITVMVQKEVAERFKAKIGEEDYNALSIIVQYLYDVNYEMTVYKNVFYPAPKVDSAVISFTPKRQRNKTFESKFFKLVQDCFRMRRKTLNNNLKQVFDNETIESIFNTCNLDKNVRGQDLSLDDYLNIYKVVYGEANE